MRFIYKVKYTPPSERNMFQKEFEVFLKVRDEVNLVLEKLRQEKQIGKASEVGLRLTFKFNWQEWHGLFSPDTLRGLLKVSELFLTHEDDLQGNLSWRFEVWNLKDDPDYNECPRCQLYHTADYYDYLCRRCCVALTMGYPEHPAVPQILLYERRKVGNNSDETPDWLNRVRSVDKHTYLETCNELD